MSESQLNAAPISDSSKPRFRTRFAVIYVVLGVILLSATYYAGYGAGQGDPIVRTHNVSRATISPKATLPQVKANFTGTPFNANATLTELPGYACSAWTNGAVGVGWVALLCTK